MDIKTRGIRAAVSYLERVGLTTVAVGPDAPTDIDILSIDGNVLIGTVVRIGRGRQVASDVSATRGKDALGALRAYRSQSDLPLEGLRVDSISLLVIAEDRALLRHHRGVLAE